MMIKRNTWNDIEKNENKIDIQYEPYLCTLKVLKCSMELNENSRINLIIKKNKGKSLYIWGKELIKSIGEDFNSKSFEIIFKGRKEEFIDLEDLVEEFNKSDWEINFNFVEVFENKNILQDFENYLKEVEKSDIDKVKIALEKNNVREKFNDIKSTTAEIGVIATMSSGKSTLINAMLGKEILPSRNEACTATIFKLENDKSSTECLYKVERKNNESLAEWKKIDLEELERLNIDQSERINIKIKGNFPGIDDNEMKIVFVDTPGPNSARNFYHKEVTYNFIKDNTDNPLVMYVLNATQLSTNDDANLLNGISESMRKNGKQAEERFIFVLNKIDKLDPEEESLEEMIKKVKNYLYKFGIKNPKVFPVSSSVAKLCRKKSAENLTLEEKEEYENYMAKFFPDDYYEGIKTFENSDLPERLKKEILDKINNSTDNNEKLLHYSGITAIELYINRYITKYIKVLKVKTAIESTKQTVDLIYSELKILREKTEEELNQLSENIKDIEDNLKDNGQDRIEKIKNRIKRLNICDEDFSFLFINLENNFYRIGNYLNQDNVNPRKASVILKRTLEEIKNIHTDLKTSVINTAIEQLSTKINEIINLLNSFYIEEINKIPDEEELKNILENQLKLDLPSVGDMIDVGYYTIEKEVQRTETRLVGVEKKRNFSLSRLLIPGGAFFSLLNPDEEAIYEEVPITKYEVEDCVNLKEVKEFYVDQLHLNLKNKILQIQNEIIDALEILKKESLKKVDILEEKIKETLRDLKEKIENQKNVRGNYEKFEIEFKKVEKIKQEIEKILEK